MTPDGVAIIDKVEEQEGMYLGVGMCGQGFMMGPGVGVNLAELIVNGKPDLEQNVFDTLSFYRNFTGKTEALK